MENGFKKITINFCEPNGDWIMTYDINDPLSALIPNAGDKVNIDGVYRQVTEKIFAYSPETIMVLIYLAETN